MSERARTIRNTAHGQEIRYGYNYLDRNRGSSLGRSMDGCVGFRKAGWSIVLRLKRG